MERGRPERALRPASPASPPSAVTLPASSARPPPPPSSARVVLSRDLYGQVPPLVQAQADEARARGQPRRDALTEEEQDVLAGGHPPAGGELGHVVVQVPVVHPLRHLLAEDGVEGGEVHAEPG